jgi:hypothetical protein
MACGEFFWKNSWSSITQMVFSVNYENTVTDEDGTTVTTYSGSETYTRAQPVLDHMKDVDCANASTGVPLGAGLLKYEVGKHDIFSSEFFETIPVMDMDGASANYFCMNEGEFMMFIHPCCPCRHIVVYRPYSVGSVEFTSVFTPTEGDPVTDTYFTVLGLPNFLALNCTKDVDNTLKYAPPSSDLYAFMDVPTTPIALGVGVPFYMDLAMTGGAGVNAEQTINFTDGYHPVGSCLVHAHGMHWRYIGAGVFGIRPTLEFLGYGDPIDGGGYTTYSYTPPEDYSALDVQITSYGVNGFRFGFIGNLAQTPIDLITWEEDPYFDNTQKFLEYFIERSRRAIDADGNFYGFFGVVYSFKYAPNVGVLRTSFDPTLYYPAAADVGDFSCSGSYSSGGLITSFTFTCT